MVLLCKVISGDELEVSHAVLLQNKDELQIPLESLGTTDLEGKKRVVNLDMNANCSIGQWIFVWKVF